MVNFWDEELDLDKECRKAGTRNNELEIRRLDLACLGATTGSVEGQMGKAGTRKLALGIRTLD